MKRRMTFPRSAKTYRPFSLTVSNCLFSLPPHSHQFGRLLLQEFTALLWHTVCAPSPPVLEYLESLKTVSRPLIFCSSTSRCFPKPFRKRLIVYFLYRVFFSNALILSIENKSGLRTNFCVCNFYNCLLHLEIFELQSAGLQNASSAVKTVLSLA